MVTVTQDSRSTPLHFRPVPPPRPKAETQLPPPLYEGGVRLHDWKHTARSGMSVDFGVRDASPVGPHPFKGLSCGREHGQRLRIWIGPGEDAEPGPEGGGEVYFTGEAILLRWSDDSVSGMSIRLGIDGGPDGAAGKHPFEGLATGRKEGEALYLAAWAVADDESLQHPARTRRRTPFHELSATRQANILCRDQRFISFLARTEAGRCQQAPAPESDPEGFAAVTLRAVLGIDSRATLGHDNADGRRSRRAWEEVLRRYFESAEWSTRG